MNTPSPRFLAILLALSLPALAQEAAENLVSNGDFESGTLSPSWEAKYDVLIPRDAAPSLSIDSTVAKSGQASLKVTVPQQDGSDPTKTYVVWWRSPLKAVIPAGSTLSFKGDLKLQKAAPLNQSQAYLALSFTPGYTDGTKKWEVDPHGKFSPLLTDWQSVDFTWKTSKEIQSLTLNLVLPFSIQEVWLDNVSIQVITP